MPPRSRARDAPSEAQIFKATYSGVPVYEMICKGVAVMRRRSDGWLNATQILKVAGLDKPQRTRVLEREVQKGEHEKVQGGYGKYQGTWVPMERGMGLARQYNVQPLLQPIADFVPASNSPPLAPKHATLPSVKTKRKPGPAEGNVMATRSSRRGAPSGAANVEDAEGEDEHMVDAVAESDPDSRRSSPPASGDGSMTSSPSEASSSSRTPSPIASEAVAMNNVHGSNQNGMDWTRNDMDAVPSGSRGRPPYPESGPLSSYTQPPPQHYPGANYIQPSHSQYPQTGRDSRRYGDIILEYFVSDTSQIPGILINPPPDFDPNMAIDDDGHTALHWACAMGRVRVVKLLLTAGADIFKVNKGGQTPLMRSVMFANNYDVRKFPELYELLHRSTLNIDNFNRTVFHHIVDVAMSKGKTHAARYYMETILNRLADFPQELADIINFQDEDGETALTLAARCRSKRLVKLLIDHGADPKIANGDAKTTEDYILEDERFRYSPVMRGQSLSFKMPFGNAGPGSSHGAYGPRLHNSTAAQHASGKCTQQMAMLLDSLAASFDQELADKERDLNQAHGLLSNIQAEILESQRAVQALKTQAGALEPAKVELQRLEEELKAKMGKRYRLGWEKWLKDEETRERSWKGTAGATGLGMGIGFDMNGTVPGMEQAADRRTRTGNGTEGDNDLEDLYNWVESIQGQGSNTVPTSVESLRKEVEGHRTKRQKVFDDFVKHSAEAGTGGRMAEYRRLIGAGCGGVPPSEVDNVIGILLETLESDESTLAAIGLSVAPNANPASSSQTDSQMTLT